jgi:mono/diheme cytochrome c family protein
MNVITRWLLLFALLIATYGYSQEAWVAPKDAANVVNPLDGKIEAIASGQKLFKSLCVACHGDLGRGDGVAATALKPKPTDFTTTDFQNQSDGTIFWKISNGRGVMASYEGMLPDKDRWAIVSYLKSLKPDKKTTNLKKKVKTNKIDNAFLFTQLINTQTTQVLPKGKAEFTIQHRFGQTSLNKNFITDFLGMDLVANLRLAYAHSFGERWYVELGRTRFSKVYDLGVKYLLLQQTKDNFTPLSIALYTNIGINTEKFPTLTEGSTFVDGSAFKYNFSHRLAYNSQLILSKKFSEGFSMQIAPVLVWHNLVAKDEKNLDFSVPIGGRIRLNYKSAILFEVVPKVIAKDKRIPLSVAYEIASSGAHAFQIIMTSTDRILEQAIYSNEVLDYSKGNFILGFNIKRIF